MSDRKKVLFSILISVILTISLIGLLPAKDRTLINIIGINGFILSILGIVIAYLQILSIKDIADKTKKTVEESIKLNNNILMISDLSRKAAMVDEIQGYLKDNKIEMCILRMKDLKIMLNSLKNQDQYNILFTKRKFGEVFQTFNIDLNNFQAHYINERYKIDKTEIIKNMEELSTLLLSVEVKLKTMNNDK